jgi:succinate dehydrogenase / fumarate reductase cytochrome b subunit
MKPLQLLFQSSIGRKFIMGVTGAILFLYVVGHLAGNLQIFLPKEKINAYAHLLHSNQALLWTVRLGLLAVVGLHIWSAIALAARNNAARPDAYGSGTAPYGASWASRHMLMTGLIIAAFVIYHLLHFTVQVPAVNLLPAADQAKDFTQLRVASGAQQGYPDVHQMLVAGFKQPLISIFYLVGVGLLCVHLSHGASSMFQSLGLQEGTWRRRLEVGAMVVAGLIFAGYASIPLAVFLRLVQ